MTRRPGRPPLDRDDPSVPLCVRVPGKHFDALCRVATETRTTLADLIRATVAETLRTQKSGRTGTGR